MEPVIWVLIDLNGQETLFRLVEVGNAADAARLASERELSVGTIDVALSLPERIESMGAARRVGQGRLIRLHIRMPEGSTAEDKWRASTTQGLVRDSGRRPRRRSRDDQIRLSSPGAQVSSRRVDVEEGRRAISGDTRSVLGFVGSTTAPRIRC